MSRTSRMAGDPVERGFAKTGQGYSKGFEPSLFPRASGVSIIPRSLAMELDWRKDFISIGLITD